MDRRNFIKSSCGACAAIATGFIPAVILEACKTPLGVVKTSSQNNIVKITLSEFGQSNYKLVRVSNYDYDLAVEKKADGSFETIVLMCTHAGQPLTKTGDSYYCTMHGSTFDHDGHVTKGPAEKDLLKLNYKTDKDFLYIELKKLS